MFNTPDNREQSIRDKMALLELKAFGKSKSKGKASELYMKDAIGKVKGKERNMHVEGSDISKVKGKDSEMPLENSTSSKDKAKQTHIRMKNKATGKSKRKENGLPVKDTTIGKDKQNDQSNSDASRTPEPLDLSTAPKSTPPSAIPNDLDLPQEVFQLQSIPTKEQCDAVYKKASSFMEDYVRPQKALPYQVARYCHLLLTPGACDAFAPFVEELRWNRAVVQHPSNPMITKILECTQHLRPADGIHHPLGISVAPVPQIPHRPPGLAPATPVITGPKKKPKKERPSIIKLKQARAKVKLPSEDPLKVLDQREATLLAQIRAGAPLSAEQVLADLMEIGQSRQRQEEKARLEIVGGRAADMVAKRLKKLAEEDGAPVYLLP